MWYNTDLMKYAVIQLQGKQYRISEGDVLTIDRLEAEAGQEHQVSEVLMLTDGDDTQIGTPTLAGHAVTLKVMEHGLDEKLRVFKYKSKSKYRKTHGHRQRVTNVQVAKIA